MELSFGLLAALGFALFALLLAALRYAGKGADDRLPEELRGARLWLAEKPLVRKRPVHVRGRPDEVWLKDGKRVIIETKSRGGRVFEGDRMQLAAYAYMMRTDGGPPLAPYGFIRFTGDGQHFEKIALKSDAAVIAAHRRLQRLQAGKETPKLAGTPALCRGCGHHSRCPAPKAPAAS